MPTHEFKCDACKNGFEIFVKVIGKGLPKKCPNCGSKKDFSQVLGCPVISMRNVTTVGQQAERNAKKFGKEQCEIMTEEQHRKKRKPFSGKLVEGAKVRDRSDEKPSEIPFYRDGAKKTFDPRKCKDIHKFIMTGKGYKE